MEFERYFDEAVALMDDELREAIHSGGEYYGDMEGFLREYERRHMEKFGREFTI